MTLRIDEIYAFVSEDENGVEGICAFSSGIGMMPMIAADMERVEQLRGMAVMLKQASGMKIKLLKFSMRSLIEEI